MITSLSLSCPRRPHRSSCQYNNNCSYNHQNNTKDTVHHNALDLEVKCERELISPNFAKITKSFFIHVILCLGWRSCEYTVSISVLLSRLILYSYKVTLSSNNYTIYYGNPPAARVPTIELVYSSMVPTRPQIGLRPRPSSSFPIAPTITLAPPKTL